MKTKPMVIAVQCILIVSHPLEIRETFSYREDKLTLRITNSRNGQVHEQFSPGRSNHLKGTYTQVYYEDNNECLQNTSITLILAVKELER